MMVAIYFAVMPFAIAYLLIGFRLHYGRVPNDAQMQAQMLREVWAEWKSRPFRARRNWSTISDTEFVEFDAPFRPPLFTASSLGEVRDPTDDEWREMQKFCDYVTERSKQFALEFGLNPEDFQR